MASALDGCVEGVNPGCTKDVSWLPPQGGSGPLGHDGGAGGVVPPGGGVFVNGQYLFACPLYPIIPSLHVALSEQKQLCWEAQGRAGGAGWP